MNSTKSLKLSILTNSINYCEFQSVVLLAIRFRMLQLFVNTIKFHKVTLNFILSNLSRYEITTKI